MTRLIHNLRSLLLLLLLCPLTQVKAQSKHYIVESISINDGLSSDFIYCFAQDKYDLTWIGTASGLNCYDGKSVKRYVNNPNDPKSLSNDLVQALYYDEKRGELWIATDQGLNRYDYASDSFIRYLHTPETPNGQAYNDIIDILPYDDNHLWLASYRGGVHLFNKNTGDLVRNQVIYTQSSHSGYMKVYSLLYDSKGELWVGTMGNGLYRYDPNSDKLKTFATRNQQHLLPTSSVRSLWEDENERVWIGTDIGVFYYNTIANSFERCSVLSFLNNQLIYFIKEITARDDRRQFWIGTELGIYIIDIGSDGMPSQVSYHLKEGPEGKGLTFRSVRNVMQDGYQNVWIATYSGGVNLIGYEEPRFAVLQKSNAEQGGLSYNKILSLAQGSNGVLWVGTDGYGINRYDVKKDEITSV